MLEQDLQLRTPKLYPGEKEGWIILEKKKDLSASSLELWFALHDFL